MGRTNQESKDPEISDAEVVSTAAQASQMTSTPHNLGGGVLAAILTTVRASVLPFDTGIFQPPSLDGYVAESQFDRDVDNDRVAETRVTKYVNVAGQVIYEYRTAGRVWAWGAMDPRAKSDVARNYGLRDSDGDGVFDERYELWEEFSLPDYVKRK